MIIAYKSNVTLSSKFKKFLRGGISEDVDGESFFLILEYVDANYQKLLSIAWIESFSSLILYSVFQTTVIPNSCGF